MAETREFFLSTETNNKYFENDPNRTFLQTLIEKDYWWQKNSLLSIPCQYLVKDSFSVKALTSFLISGWVGGW